MLIRAFLACLLLLLPLSRTASISASTFYVRSSISASGNGQSWETAFKKIQEGIDAACDGDTVVVAEGTYVENVKFNGKNIVLTSTGPLDPDTVANTVIDGNKAGSVVTFAGTENGTCVVSGFTIRNGKAERGGGVYGVWADATISQNVITGNSAEMGGGLYLCDGTIRGNTISGNSASGVGDRGIGGGLCACDGLVRDNEIAGNSARLGGGLYYCNGTIQGNIISGNSASGEYYSDGGGLYWCGASIDSNTICRNSSQGRGGGLYLCDGPVQNNTICENVAQGNGGGLGACDGSVRKNTIIANKTGRNGGGLHWCDGTIENNTIRGNSAHSFGGGLHSCDGAILNNSITGNIAGVGGGGLSGSDHPVRNNLIAGNSAQLGGGLYGCLSIENNTIYGNKADEGGGLHRCQPTIASCVIWANTATIGPHLVECAIPTFSCVQDWMGGGEGNIATDPGFIDPDGRDDDPTTFEDNDFRLSLHSPCIDAGRNEEWMWNAVDLLGDPRILRVISSLTVDMGAYECLPFKIMHIAGVPDGGITLFWESRGGDIFTIWSREDLSAGTWAKEARVLLVAPDPRLGMGLSWTDPGPTARIKFYRLQIE